MFYVEKEMSWLSFNERVLQEAKDKTNPLIERMRFLGIYSNNLDEFYKVRFANLKRHILIGKEKKLSNNQYFIFKKIKKQVIQYEQQLHTIYKNLIMEMADNKIFLINELQLSDNQQIWLRQYFKSKLIQHVIPIVINNKTNLTKFLKDNFNYLVIKIIYKKNNCYALLKIPSDKSPRFIKIPTESKCKHNYIIILDNILRYCLDEIFKGFYNYDTIKSYSMKIIRDAKYSLISDELECSLLDLVSSSLKQRLTAETVRLVYQRDMPVDMVKMLCHKLSITNLDSVIPSGRYHNFKDFINFPNIGKNNLINLHLPPVHHVGFSKVMRNYFDAIRNSDILLYYPYYTFEHILELLQQASFDPKVLSIKINIYRVAKNSRIIDAMIHAAYNGKKVTVVVELQARFDEKANIYWSKRLIEAGVHVIFSVPGLKIHAKLFLISRQEKNTILLYGHIGTGNFNEKTARFYTDYSLLTSDTRITNEISQVFNFIKNPYVPVKFHYLIVSPQNSRSALYRLIDNEIANIKRKLPAAITLKLNNLVDTGLINKLYKASSFGVKIDLLVRSMCTLIPNIPGISDNIRIISIVDRYLEHDRVYIFENKGNKKIFISSADWMTRNIDYRIEVAVAILDPKIKKRILNIVNIQLNDTVKARIIDKTLSNAYVKPKINKIRSQLIIYEYIKNLEKIK
nr:polyphosphate kinase 1 [Pantoea sp. SoEX]